MSCGSARPKYYASIRDPPQNRSEGLSWGGQDVYACASRSVVARPATARASCLRPRRLSGRSEPNFGPRYTERSSGPKFHIRELKTTELKFRDDNNFALGFSTNQAENFQGYHGKYVLIIADEAPGIEPGIWDAVAGTMAGGKVHIVMAGNPTIPSGAFFDAFTKERGLWNCFTIDAFDSPNLEGTRP